MTKFDPKMKVLKSNRLRLQRSSLLLNSEAKVIIEMSSMNQKCPED